MLHLTRTINEKRMETFDVGNNLDYPVATPAVRSYPLNVYLAGSMSGKENYNFPAFHKYAAQLRAQGHTVFSPAEADLERFGTLENLIKEWRGQDEYALAKNYRDAMRIDLNWILDNADAIALIPGWESSKGVAAELALAKCLKLEEIYLD